MLRVRGIAAVGLAAWLACGAAAADEPAPTYDKMSLEELLGTRIALGSLETETIFNTPSTISVIDRESIERYNFLSLAEALRVLAGFDVGRTHLKREVPTSRGILQEHYSNKVLLMIDNVPAWNAVTGEASLDRIAIEDVERIEVLKGPASVLYGTNAYAGAVNVVLRLPDGESTVSARGGAGSLGAYGAGGRYTHSARGTKVFVAADSRDEEGHDLLFVDEQREAGHIQEYTRGSHLTARVERAGHSLFLNGFVAHESFLGTSLDYDSGVGHDQVSHGSLAAYSYSRKIGRRTHVNAGAQLDHEHRDFSRSRGDMVRSSVLGYRASAFATAGIVATRALGFEAGADYEYRKSVEYTSYDVHRGLILDDNNMRDRHLGERSVFGQVRLDHQPLKLLLGSRLTHNDLFGSNISSRGTLVYSIDETNSLKLILGQSYRAPSFFELYFQTPANTVYGNPMLRPETSDSVELAYLTSVRSLFLQALLYHARYDGKIFRQRRVPDDPRDRSTVYVNGAPFHANGLELELKYQAPKVADVFASYNLLDGDHGDEIDGNGHYNFKYVPRHALSLGMAKAFGRMHVSGVLNAQSSVDGPLRRIDGYGTLDVNVAYAHAVGGLVLRHTASVKDVADEREPLPEFIRRSLNDIPSGNARRFVYTLSVRPRGND
jgi:outer membrane receptor protein involved in Fe transport